MNYFTQSEIEEIAFFVKYKEKTREQVDAEIGFAERKAKMESLKTRQLLQILNVTRAGSHDFFIYDEVKEVLATREHVPNKKEAKLLRQQAAKKYKGTRNKNK